MTFVIKNSEKSVEKHLIEKHILLNFLNLYAILVKADDIITDQNNQTLPNVPNYRGINYPLPFSYCGIQGKTFIRQLNCNIKEKRIQSTNCQ